MKETIKTIVEWHEKTFPDATLDGQIEKFVEEEGEYNENPNLLELADMYIVACGISRFDSILALKYFAKVRRKLNNRIWARCGGNDVFRAVVEDKMKKNRNRVWGKSGDGVYHLQLGIED